MTTRIYLITNGKQTHLVEAASQAQALRVVVEGQFSVTVPSARQVAGLMETGVKVTRVAPNGN
jgi:hypothetical protein